jgi:serine protease
MKKLILLCLFALGLWLALANFKGLAGQGQFNSLIVNFRDDIPTSTISNQLDAIAQQFKQPAALNSIFSTKEHIYILKGDGKLLTALGHSPLKQYVEYIEPNYIYQAYKAPNDPDYSKQWNFRSINVERAWEETQGQGVTVAIIDTGVSRVPDLQQTEFVGGYDFVNDRDAATDDSGHGTHIAGTIAQSTNNNYGVAGIAYAAKIMPLKVLSASGSGTVADIAEAIRFAADNGAAVINLSLGGAGDSRLLQEAIDYAYNKQVVIVAAAGNGNQNAATYPARYPHAISVAATDAAGQKAPYSNFGAGIDIAAPGGSETGKILQETIDTKEGQAKFAGFAGTSMAAPHVAGVAALIKAAGVAQPEAVSQILQQSARKVEEDPFNHFGAGQLDAGEAVRLAKQGQVTVRDFFRWLRENGYLNPRFWFDGGAVALLPKLLMVLGSYLLAFLLRVYFPFRWGWSFNSGLILGSCGLFLLQGFYIFDLPQWPFRLMGSSLTELGSVLQGGQLLNPAFASFLIPFCLLVLLWGRSAAKLFATGTALGVTGALAVSAILAAPVWGIPQETAARTFLGVNALVCLGLAYFALRGETTVSSNS